MKAWTALIPIVAVAIGLAACGSDDDPAGDAGARATPDETIATIGTRTISKKEFERHVAFAHRTYQKGTAPSRRRLEEDTLDKLLLQAAIAQEAAERGIRISKREAHGYAVNAMKGSTREAYKKNRLGPFSVEDFAGQLRSAALGVRLGQKIQSDGGDPKRFLDSLPRRWRARAICDPAYRTDHCRRG